MGPMDTESTTRMVGRIESSRRQIRGRECVNLIRSGMTDDELRERYQLSPKGLEKLYQALIDANQISEEEVCERSVQFRERVHHLNAQGTWKVVDLNLPLWIYEVESSGRGLVRDISGAGLRIAGITSSVGEEKTFRLPVDMLLCSDYVTFTARCVWIKKRGKRVKYLEGGYQIESISPDDKCTLTRLADMLVLSGSGEWAALT